MDFHGSRRNPGAADSTGGRTTVNGNLRRILVLSIWEKIWSLGEGSGVSDELHFVEHFTAAGIELHFLIPEPRGTDAILERPGLSYHTYPNIFRRYGRLPTAAKRIVWPAAFNHAATGRLRELSREIEPDLLLGFSHYTLRPLSDVGPRCGIPTAVKLFGVMHLGRLDLPRLQYWRRNFEQIMALRHPVDRYIVLNDGTMGNAALQRLGVPPEKIVFLPNGMDTEWANITVDRAAARDELGLPRDTILIVTLSRLVASKRIDLFLQAAASISPARLGNATFVIAGDGPDRGRLEAEAARLGIGDRVVFTGVIPHDDIVRFLKCSDIFVGTNELTNMSLPPCEAILCGVPVVAFDVSGTSEVVRDGETGLLVNDTDVAALAERIAILIEDGGLRERLGAGAAAFGRRHFMSWPERMAKEIAVLTELVKR